MADRKRQKKPFSVNNFSIKITFGTEANSAYWAKCTAPKKSWGKSEYSDGQTNIVYQLPGAITYEDVTLTKAFTEDDDTLMSALLAANTTNDFIQVDIQPVYRDGYYAVNVGGLISLMYCTVVSVQPFSDIDIVGNNTAMLEVVLSPGYIQSQGNKSWWKEPTTTGADAATGTPTTTV